MKIVFIISRNGTSSNIVILEQKPKKYLPMEGFEPSTTRLKVVRSTN